MGENPDAVFHKVPIDSPQAPITRSTNQPIDCNRKPEPVEKRAQSRPRFR